MNVCITSMDLTRTEGEVEGLDEHVQVDNYIVCCLVN